MCLNPSTAESTVKRTSFLTADLDVCAQFPASSGTRCQMNLEIRTVFDGFKRFLKTIIRFSRD